MPQLEIDIPLRKARQISLDFEQIRWIRILSPFFFAW